MNASLGDTAYMAGLLALVDPVVSYSSMVPFYLVFGFLSVLGAAAVTFVYLLDSRLHRDHASTLILIMTLMDFLYTLKYIVGATAWVSGNTNERDSFHILNDNCMSSTAYGQFMGMASISWNACWTFDFLCVLSNPLRNTASQRRWYHLFVWTMCVATTVYVLAASANERAADDTCWIRADNTNSLIFEVPLYFYIALALFSLVYAAMRLRRGTRASINVRRALFARHATYVLAFIFVWLWPIVHRFADENDSNFVFTVLDVVSVSGQAFFFACIRLSEPGAWAIFTDLLQRYFCLPFYKMGMCDAASACYDAVAGVGPVNDPGDGPDASPRARVGGGVGYDLHWNESEKYGDEWIRSASVGGAVGVRAIPPPMSDDGSGVAAGPSSGSIATGSSSAWHGGGGGGSLPTTPASIGGGGDSVVDGFKVHGSNGRGGGGGIGSLPRRPVPLWKRLRWFFSRASGQTADGAEDGTLLQGQPHYQTATPPDPGSGGSGIRHGGSGRSNGYSKWDNGRAPSPPLLHNHQQPSLHQLQHQPPPLSPESSAAWHAPGGPRPGAPLFYSAVGPGRGRGAPPDAPASGAAASLRAGSQIHLLAKAPGPDSTNFNIVRKPRAGSMDATADSYLTKLAPAGGNAGAPYVAQQQQAAGAGDGAGGHDRLRQVLLAGGVESTSPGDGDGSPLMFFGQSAGGQGSEHSSRTSGGSGSARSSGAGGGTHASSLLGIPLLHGEHADGEGELTHAYSSSYQPPSHVSSSAAASVAGAAGSPHPLHVSSPPSGGGQQQPQRGQGRQLRHEKSRWDRAPVAMSVPAAPLAQAAHMRAAAAAASIGGSAGRRHAQPVAAGPGANIRLLPHTHEEEDNEGDDGAPEGNADDDNDSYSTSASDDTRSRSSDDTDDSGGDYSDDRDDCLAVDRSPAAALDRRRRHRRHRRLGIQSNASKSGSITVLRQRSRSTDDASPLQHANAVAAAAADSSAGAGAAHEFARGLAPSPPLFASSSDTSAVAPVAQSRSHHHHSHSSFSSSDRSLSQQQPVLPPPHQRQPSLRTESMSRASPQLRSGSGLSPEHSFGSTSGGGGGGAVMPMSPLTAAFHSAGQQQQQQLSGVARSLQMQQQLQLGWGSGGDVAVRRGSGLDSPLRPHTSSSGSGSGSSMPPGVALTRSVSNMSPMTLMRTAVSNSNTQRPSVLAALAPAAGSSFSGPSHLTLTASSVEGDPGWGTAASSAHSISPNGQGQPAGGRGGAQTPGPSSFTGAASLTRSSSLMSFANLGGGGGAAGSSSSGSGSSGGAAPSSSTSAGAPPPSSSSSSSSAVSSTPHINAVRPITHEVDKNAISSSSGTGWDIGAGLRLELGMCMLSALCQALLEGEAERRVELAVRDATAAAALAGRGATFPPSSSPAPPPSGPSSSGSAQPAVASAPQAPPASSSSSSSLPHSPSGTTLAALSDARTPAELEAAAATASNAVPVLRRAIATSLKDTSSVPHEFTLLQDFDCDEYLEAALARATARWGGCGAVPVGANGKEVAPTGGGAGSGGGPPAPRGAARAPVATADSFECVSLAGAAFAQLRAAAALNVAQVVYSLDPGLLRTGGLRAHFSDGASSSFFCRSHDGTLVVKTISGEEAEELLRLLPAYAGHMLSQPDSLLCRFYGAYALKLPSSKRVFFLLMGNVFPISDAGPRAETYDLKGSTVGRRARVTKSLVSRNEATGKLVAKGMLWQDTEFRERYPRGLPASDVDVMLRALDPAAASTARPLGDLTAGVARSRAIVDQLERDVTLLARHGLMDYSLLVNVQPVTGGAGAYAAAQQPAAPSHGAAQHAAAPPLQPPPPPLVARIDSVGDTVSVSLSGESGAVDSMAAALAAAAAGGASPFIGVADGGGGESGGRASPPTASSIVGSASTPPDGSDGVGVAFALSGDSGGGGSSPTAGGGGRPLPSPSDTTTPLQGQRGQGQQEYQQQGQLMHQQQGQGQQSLPLLPLPTLEEGRPAVTSFVALENQVDGTLTAVDTAVASALAGSNGGGGGGADVTSAPAAAAAELVAAAVTAALPHEAAEGGYSGGGGGGPLSASAGSGGGGGSAGSLDSSSASAAAAALAASSLLRIPPPSTSVRTLTQELIYGVSYKLSFSHSSELGPNDAATLVRAAASLPSQIAAVGDALSRHRAGKMTRWSPLAVSLVAMGKPMIAPPASSSSGGGGGTVAAQGGAATDGAPLQPPPLLLAPPAGATASDTSSHHHGMSLASTLAAAATGFLGSSPLTTSSGGGGGGGHGHAASASSGGGGVLSPPHLFTAGSGPGAPAHEGAATGVGVGGGVAPPPPAGAMHPIPYSRRAIVQVGVIDCLQTYNTSKRIENAFKTLRYKLGHVTPNEADISSVDPMRYAVRFIEFARNVFLPTVVGGGGGGAGASSSPLVGSGALLPVAVVPSPSPSLFMLGAHGGAGAADPLP